jgi:amidophosphoribosyltransferase
MSVFEKCAVFGIYGIDKNLEASRCVHAGLWALQHRGQESTGIASTVNGKVCVHKGMGLVAHVYNEKILSELPGNIAIGHNRYSTFGSSSNIHSQPISSQERSLAFAHNGNLPSVKKLKDFLSKKGIGTRFSNDSELMYKAVTYFFVKNKNLAEAVTNALPLFTGVFCGLFMSKDTLVAVRDRFGIRPLFFGKINGSGYVVSSETCAIDTISGQLVGDIKPGQMLVIDKNGPRFYQLAKGKESIDVFEFVYFARPDSFLLGQNVNQVRQNLGCQLAIEYPNIKADVVVPVPDSGIPAAIGFSKQSGIPFDIGLIKNRYIHRTFIRPAQSLRQKDVKLKLNPLSSVLKGKRVILVDDSIVRGTTSQQVVDLIRLAGAKQVHFMVSSPPIRFPDFYGINISTQLELIAFNKSILDIKKFIKADSLYYLSLKGMYKAIGVPKKNLCTSCFTGDYPVDIGLNKRNIKY